jgi:CheY-like chemotaxis protein
MGDNNGMPAVLIVEDSENSAAMLEIAFLGIPGVSVLMAPSATEALRLLEGGSGTVRVMVTDLNMPRMDGYELIRRVRADQRLSGMPIIVVSADTDPANPQRIAALGVEAFFPKPFSPALVRRKLEQLLDVRTQ